MRDGEARIVSTRWWQRCFVRIPCSSARTMVCGPTAAAMTMSASAARTVMSGLPSMSSPLPARVFRLPLPLRCSPLSWLGTECRSMTSRNSTSGTSGVCSSLPKRRNAWDYCSRISITSSIISWRPEPIGWIAPGVRPIM